jgi:Tfp pilus assembly protein PilN
LLVCFQQQISQPTARQQLLEQSLKYYSCDLVSPGTTERRIVAQASFLSLKAIWTCRNHYHDWMEKLEQKGKGTFEISAPVIFDAV